MKHDLRKAFGLHLKSIITGFFLLTLSATSMAATGNWASNVTKGNIVYTTSESASPMKDYNG
ncbi:MAG: hypothetical protein PHS84_13010, partial [Paludibacter sp.]|nr:hypothetical protein [Paludibacter sp.]